MSDVRFIRKNGKVIPIRNKPNPVLRVAKSVERTTANVARIAHSPLAKEARKDFQIARAIPSGLAAGFGAGIATHKVLTGQENRLNKLGTRIFRVLKRSNNNGIFANSGLGGFRRNSMPDLFAFQKYQKDLKRFNIARLRINKWKPIRKDVLDVARNISKFKLRASIAAGALVALGVGYSVLKDN